MLAQKNHQRRGYPSFLRIGEAPHHRRIVAIVVVPHRRVRVMFSECHCSIRGNVERREWRLGGMAMMWPLPEDLSTAIGARSLVVVVVVVVVMLLSTSLGGKKGVMFMFA